MLPIPLRLNWVTQKRTQKTGTHTALRDLDNLYHCLEIEPDIAMDSGCNLLGTTRKCGRRDATEGGQRCDVVNPISDAAIERLPQVDTNNDLDLPPSLPETIRTVQQISSGKSPGSGAIPPEVYKHGGPRLMAEFITLFLEMWRHGQDPQDFEDVTIINVYQRKGKRQF
ncbi:unnamed protein product [Schistocephalus solidus]|uniref:Uncharacterized protein n=1 Tax=Schistocephalus solidus TaxID=70667 RepID=A0A183TQR0_SCHSO|nr:unnamed protein product [Schistocephalus solidus]